MEQSASRQRITKESTVRDMADSIRELSKTLTSINGRHVNLLKVNRELVSYIQSKKEHNVQASERGHATVEQD